MISLFLDTCNSNILIGLLRENKLINSISFINNNSLSEELLTNIDNLIKESNYNIKDIKKIYISIGPGSFTGIRIGVTVAKTMAWGLKINIVPISSLEVMASINTNKTYICPLIDARRGFVYTGIYNQKLDIIYENKYIKLDEFMKENKNLTDNMEFVSYDKLFDDILIPNIDIEKIVTKHLNDESINAHMINPVYLKLTQAEENLNDNTN